MYARYDYPALRERQMKVAQEIGADKVLLYNDGMAAVNGAIESLHLTKGDVLLYSPSIYGESKNFIEKDLMIRGVKCIPIKSGEKDELNKLIDQYRPKAIFTETVGNAQDMPVVDLKNLFEKTEEMNEKYQKDLNLPTLIEKQLFHKDWIRDWLTAGDWEGAGRGEKYSPEQKAKLENLVKEFEGTARKINKEQSYMPLKDLLRDLEEEAIMISEDRRGALLELKSLFDTVWLAKREMPMTLILDNTLPTETNLNLPQEIKKTKASVLVVDSGTKFFAKDKTTIGVAYSNDPNKLLELEIERMREGTYPPKSSEARLPETTKKEFNIRNKQILSNTKILAQGFSKAIGRMGITAVSHPNLPTHPNYEYTEKNLPDGATAVFYIQCENAWETADKLEKGGLKGLVEYGGSFAFEKTRVGVFGDMIRIAGGNESPEELEKILDVIETVK
ncbi:MAG: PLP-dependent transferase [Patescibacteria group bacterium]|nr:PLP-dependent transferase [Patescibacteria group bacterium]